MSDKLTQAIIKDLGGDTDEASVADLGQVPIVGLSKKREDDNEEE